MVVFTFPGNWVLLSQGIGFYFPRDLVFTFPRIWFLLSQKTLSQWDLPLQILGIWGFAGIWWDLAILFETFVNFDGVDFGIWWDLVGFGGFPSWDSGIQFLGI